jgi:hypothetical protein
MIPQRLQSLDTDLNSADESVRARVFSELSESEHEEALATLWRARNKEGLQVEAAEAFKNSVLAHPKTALRHVDSDIRAESLRLSGEHKSKSAIEKSVELFATMVRLTCVNWLLKHWAKLETNPESSG